LGKPLAIERDVIVVPAGEVALASSQDVAGEILVRDLEIAHTGGLDWCRERIYSAV
jgi:hypothetical protein